MKKLTIIIKKIVFAPFVLYIFNLISLPFNLIIPINIFNVFIVSILGIPGLISLILFKLIAF